MADRKTTFAINVYSYTQKFTGIETVRHLAGLGYRDLELMMYPGHLWAADLDAGGRRELRRVIDECGCRLVALNMPNIDLNVAGASREMRQYSLALISEFTELAGDLGAESILIGPGKQNPLFPAPRDELLGHFYKALDTLHPIARQGGTRILVENMPFAFLPDAPSLMKALDDYGNDDIHVLYDVANGHFIGEDPGEGLRCVKDRLRLVHVSDTGQRVYRHDPVGRGDVPFAGVPAVMKEVGYRDKPMLEIISENPDADIEDSVNRLYEMGYR
ncbi:MAG TPA: sugar phosphate isomerase/epimerase family protein [Geminicoccaceae bacterium]